MSLIDKYIAESAAVFHDDHQWDASRMLRRFFPCTDLDALDEVCSALRASETVTNPLAGQRCFEGVWQRVSCTHAQLGERGLGILDVLVQGDGMSDEYARRHSCSLLETLTRFEALADLPSLPLNDPNTATVYWLENIRRDAETNLWSGALVKSQRLTRTLPRELVTDSAGLKVYRTIWDGAVKIGAEFFTTGGSAITFPVAATGISIRKRVDLSDHCSYTLSVDELCSQELETAEIVKTPLFESSGAGKINDRTELPEPSRDPEAGETLRFSRVQQDDGSWKWDERFELVPERTVKKVKYRGSTKVLDSTSTHGQKVAPAAAAAAPRGTVRTQNVEQKSDGSFDEDLFDETVEERDGSVKIWQGSNLVEQRTIQSGLKEDPTEIAAGDLAAGTTIEERIEEEEAETVRHVLRVVTEPPLPGETRDAAFLVSELETFSNAFTTPPTYPQYVQNQRKTVRWRKKENELYEVTSRTQTAEPWSSEPTVVQRATYTVFTLQLFRNQPDGPDAAGEGERIVGLQINGFGSWDYGLQREVPRPQSELDELTNEYTVNVFQQFDKDVSVYRTAKSGPYKDFNSGDAFWGQSSVLTDFVADGPYRRWYEVSERYFGTQEAAAAHAAAGNASGGVQRVVRGVWRGVRREVKEALA